MINKVKYITLFVIIFSLGLSVKSFARITTNDPTVNSGETVTITISSQEPVASGAIDVSSNGGLTFQSVTGGTANGTKVAFAKSENATNGLATYTFKAPEVSSNTVYKVIFSSNDMANADGEEVSSSSATATVTVKGSEAKQETPIEQSTETSTNAGTTETPKNEEPDFTETNKTMYSTKGINLRESWSTSSKATYIEKDTELTVTAMSTKTVNGYVWYRVSYQGQTKYVASFLLTSTKPQEEETPTEEKSNNANLKTLTVEGQELIPKFSQNVTSYTLQVPEETTKLEIKAEPEDAKATVSTKGNDILVNEGESIITVSVSAEDGTVKIYEIKVEKVSQEVQGLGLKSLKIEGTDINSKFKPNVYNYEINIDKSVANLKIEAISNDETATVEILGNENFKDGENLVTIIVSSKDGENKVTYQIKVNRGEQAAQTSTTNKTEKKPSNKIFLYIGIGVVLSIALIIVVIYTIKHRNLNEHDEGFHLPNKLPESNENNDYETRKKGKHF